MMQSSPDPSSAPGEPRPTDHNTPSPPAADGAEMGFLDHLEELRWTLAKCLGVFLLSAALISAFLPWVASVLEWPLHWALGRDALAQGGLVTTSPFGVFSVVLQLIILGGLAASLPFMLYFVARFVAPGLTPAERAVLRPACWAVLGLFVIGAAFAFFILCPAALLASKAFNDLFGFQLVWSADRYYGMLVWMTLGVGLTFEFPLILIVLIYIGVLSTRKLAELRPYSIVAFLVLAAVVTPTTDPITFLLLALPLSGLYEVARLVGIRIERRRAEHLASHADD